MPAAILDGCLGELAADLARLGAHGADGGRLHGICEGGKISTPLCRSLHLVVGGLGLRRLRPRQDQLLIELRDLLVTQCRAFRADDVVFSPEDFNRAFKFPHLVAKVAQAFTQPLIGTPR